MIDNNEKKATYVIISEILLALLPIIIYFSIMLVTSESILQIFTKSHVSFISVFFFGQALVKLFSGISKSKTRKNWQVIMLFSSGILVIGLIPSTIWLCIIHLELYKNCLMYIFQFTWFCISLFTYFIIGKVGQMYLDEKENSN